MIDELIQKFKEVGDKMGFTIMQFSSITEYQFKRLISKNKNKMHSIILVVEK